VINFQDFSSYWKLGKPNEDNQPILKNITLQVFPGDIVSIIGKIGSGKSTLLNCLIGEVP
jgi:ABC-type lipoprotein export system ATPase subunit